MSSSQCTKASQPAIMIHSNMKTFIMYSMPRCRRITAIRAMRRVSLNQISTGARSSVHRDTQVSRRASHTVSMMKRGTKRCPKKSSRSST